MCHTCTRFVCMALSMQCWAKSRRRVEPGAGSGLPAAALPSSRCLCQHAVLVERMRQTNSVVKALTVSLQESMAQHKTRLPILSRFVQAHMARGCAASCTLCKLEVLTIAFLLKGICDTVHLCYGAHRQDLLTCWPAARLTCKVFH